MSFGSFWTGIKLVKLDKDTGKLADPKADPIAIARREDSVDAIEGSYILPMRSSAWALDGSRCWLDEAVASISC